MKKLFMIIGLALLTTVGVQAQSETLRVWLDSHITLTADGNTVTYLKLYENDGDQGYTSFNMSLIVPKGIRVNQVKQGRETKNDISLSERATSTHSIACNMPSDTLLKIACISTLNQELFVDDEEGNPLDEVCTIGLTADTSMENGDYIVSMPAAGLIFNMKKGDTYVSSRIKEDVKCVFTIIGGVITSVRQIENMEENDALYDLHGYRINTPLKHGVYIKNGKKIAK